MESLKTELEQAGVLDVTGDLLEQLMNVGRDIGILDGENLSNEWVSFVHNQGRDCPLTKDNIHKFHAHLKILSVKTRPQTTPNSTTAAMPMYTSQDLDTLINGVSDDEDDMANIMSGYGGGESAMVKIKDSKMKSPPVRNKTITRPYIASSIDDQSPSVQSVQMTNTPYSQRLNIRKVVCELNGSVINDGGWVESEGVVKKVEVLSGLTDVVPHMYQTFSQKVDVMVNRMEEIGYKICQANHLPEATMETPLLTITTEPALYLGRVVCDGEGKLNAHSCLLQGVESFQHGYRHKLSQAVLLIPSDGSLPPSCLFPGQVIIVEGVLNHSRVLTPSKIYSHSCLSPNKPLRDSVNINALSGIIAAGPFALSDSLDMTPLHDLLTIVSQQKPHILVIVGPFIEDNHISLKVGSHP
jgi:DNA polymerase alpha subunit B